MPKCKGCSLRTKLSHPSSSPATSQQSKVGVAAPWRSLVVGLEGRWQLCTARRDAPRRSQTPSRVSKGIDKLAGGRKEEKEKMLLERRCTRDENSFLDQICVGGSLPGQGPALNPATKGCAAPSKRHAKDCKIFPPLCFKELIWRTKTPKTKNQWVCPWDCIAPVCFRPAPCSTHCRTDKPRINQDERQRNLPTCPANP